MNLADGRLEGSDVEVTAELVNGSHTSRGANVLTRYESRVYRLAT